MGIYVDAEDVRQHLRGGQGISIESIDELMEEQENYVQTRLRLSTLPPDNIMLRNIIRELTIAACIYELTPPNDVDVLKADNIRKEAIRRLDEVDKRIGLGQGTRPDRDPASEIITPPSVYFKPEDFGIIL